ncbi:MAG: hypothetical protein K8S99_16550 [Planctomycetes bacterium]|nr:hypothetical protein [Planctomycetota bacterium]
MGFLVCEQLPIKVDLFAEPGPLDHSPLAFARALAALKFREQLTKHRLDAKLITAAWMHIEKLPGEVEGRVGDGHMQPGYLVCVAAHADVHERGQYQSVTTLFVAPHNAITERRRHESDWGRIT